MTRRMFKHLPIMLASSLLLACEGQQYTEVVGILEWDRLELTAEANEPIIEIHIQEGETLAAGQVILQLDPSRTLAQRNEAEAARAQAAAKLAELERGPRPELIEAARARLRGTESELQRAVAEYQRIHALVEKQLSTAEALDSARAQRDRARAERDAARAELEALLAGTTVEELQQAEGALNQTEARLQTLEITLERLTLRAPREGVLDALPYELGERPAAGAVIAVMLAGQTPYARVYIPEPSRAHINQGTPARVYVDGISEAFSGRVRTISRDAVFTPFYSLTERDRSRLSYLAEVELTDGASEVRTLSSGIPVKVVFPAQAQ
jgi:HlyD family secretion protein